MNRIRLFIFALLCTAPSFAATFYVTVSGSGSMNGSSWANAYASTSLQTAINGASSGDQIWVACGTYKPTTGSNRDISFSLKNGVAVYGGFQGTETSLSQRSISCSSCTILSGEIGSSNLTDNSYDVIRNQQVALNNNTVLDGFVIKDGYDIRPATNDTGGLGAGMYNRGINAANPCNPTIRNCIFTNNTSVFGAGIFNHGSYGRSTNPIISNCIFYNNTATDGGGAIDNFGINSGSSASPTISNCLFYNNTALTAGAIYNWGGNGGNASPQISNCTFANNTATNGNAGAIIADNANSSGGGNSGTSNPSLSNCIVWGNTASATGNQFYCKGTATFTATYSDIDLTGQTAPHIISGAGTGNINSNPLFINSADADGTDNCLLTSDDGLRLQSSSPCINTGTNSGVASTDIAGSNRIENSTVDMGAYEYNNSVLPITLLNFSGAINLKEHLLTWATASSFNNSHFEIERRSANTDFVPIGRIVNQQEGSITLSYQFSDEQPLAGTNYYRLKQVDFDGQFSYSKTIALKNNSNALQVFPNPVVQQLTLTGLATGMITVHNSLGQLILQKECSTESSTIDTEGWPSGIYYVHHPETGEGIRLVKE